MTESTAAQRASKQADKDAIRPFQKVNCPEAELTELRRRINATKWPERETVTDATQGGDGGAVNNRNSFQKRCTRASDHCAS